MPVLDFAQVAPSGWVAVPRWLIDRMDEMTGAEVKALLYIARHTLGWQKLSDAISYSQFIEGVKTNDGKLIDRGAGIKSRSTLTAALAGLESKGFITRRAGAVATVYSLAAPSSEIEPARPAPQAEASSEIEPTIEPLNKAECEEVKVIVDNLPIKPQEAEQLATAARAHDRGLGWLKEAIARSLLKDTPAAFFKAAIRGNYEFGPGAGRADLRPVDGQRRGRSATRPGPIDFSKYGPGGKYGYLFQAGGEI